MSSGVIGAAICSGSKLGGGWASERVLVRREIVPRQRFPFDEMQHREVAPREEAQLGLQPDRADLVCHYCSFLARDGALEREQLGRRGIGELADPALVEPP